MTDKLSVHIYLFFTLPKLQCIEPLFLLLLILTYTSAVHLFSVPSVPRSIWIQWCPKYVFFYVLHIIFSHISTVYFYLSSTGPVEITFSLRISVLLNVVTCDRHSIIAFRYGALKHPSSILQHLKHLFDISCDRKKLKVWYALLQIVNAEKTKRLALKCSDVHSH